MSSERAGDLDATDVAPLEGDTGVSAPPGECIAGRYEILGLVGAGGMGTVYRVRDRELDEVVALKTLRHGWIDAPGALERFKREVKLARRVTHRNVAPARPPRPASRVGTNCSPWPNRPHPCLARAACSNSCSPRSSRASATSRGRCKPC